MADTQDNPARGSQAPRVSILVISYNTREMTLECLRSVIRETQDVPYEIIVVDNQSSDGSGDAIAVEFPDIRLIRSAENLGFARANNVAALEAKGEYLLLLNPDTVVLDKAIDRILKFAEEHPHAGIWGGRTLYADRSLNPTSCWGRMTLWNSFCRAFGLAAVFSASELFNPEGYGNWQRDTVREVDIVTGCFLLIRHDLWRQLEGFNPAFFMYGEEADLCLRAQKLGARPTLNPKATIVHYGSASETVPADKMVKMLRGKMTIIRHHWPRAQRWLGRLLFRFNALLRTVCYSVAAFFLRTTRLQEKAQLWRTIWSQRREWLHGYM